MTIDLDTLRCRLDAAGHVGSDELCRFLPDVCPALFAGSPIQVERLNARVFRVRDGAAGPGPSIVVKRLEPSLADRSERVIRRWLPALGLTDLAPALLGTIRDRHGTCVWHVYEDAGPTMLDARHPQSDLVAAAVKRISQLHTSAAQAPILAECREQLDDLGMPYFVANVTGAIAALESFDAVEGARARARREVRDRLLERLWALRESVPRRARLMEALGSPETFLHGDLWTINAVVSASAQGPQARLIDWERAGVGPITYDLSTFLYRFPPSERSWILQQYRDEIRRAGWYLPDAADLNVLFETAECARYANRIVWPAMGALGDNSESDFDELAQILGWFEALEPVLTS